MQIDFISIIFASDYLWSVEFDEIYIIYSIPISCAFVVNVGQVNQRQKKIFNWRLLLYSKYKQAYKKIMDLNTRQDDMSEIDFQRMAQMIATSIEKMIRNGIFINV